MGKNEKSMLSTRYKIIRFLQGNQDVFFTIKYWRLRFRMLFFRKISDRAYIEMQYRQRTGRKLNLENPQLYNEKVQYSKLYYHNPKLKQLVDKAAVRQYVKDTIGDKYLTHLYGVYDDVKDIPFEHLPDQFVLKLTNGSGFNYICSQKSEKHIAKIRKRFAQWLQIDFFMLGREWAYKGIKNRIICEEYLEGNNPSGLNDYKVFCFNGEPKVIQVDFARFTNHRRNLYTPSWEFIDEKVAYENDPEANLAAPANLDEMLQCARKLSAGFPHVRVDFYSIGDRLVFGEMTFYHGAGYLHFENEEFERLMGSYWEL